jgi:hypothetical protein
VITGSAFTAFWQAKIDAYLQSVVDTKYAAARTAYVAGGMPDSIPDPAHPGQVIVLWDESKVRQGLRDDLTAQMDGLLGTSDAGYTDGLLYQIFVFMADSAEVQSVVIGSGIPVAIDPLDPLVGATTADGEQSGTGRIQ